MACLILLPSKQALFGRKKLKNKTMKNLFSKLFLNNNNSGSKDEGISLEFHIQGFLNLKEKDILKILLSLLFSGSIVASGISYCTDNNFCLFNDSHKDSESNLKIQPEIKKKH